MKLTFRNGLAPNVASAVVGMATQAALAPLFLLVLSVDQFAVWVLVASVSSYVGLAANGYFYALINEVTIANVSGDRERAVRAFTVGYATIVGLSLIALALVPATYLSPFSGTVVPLLVVGIATAIVNFSFTMADASFRAIGLYARGTNILTGFRLAEFVVSFAAVALTRSVEAALLTLLAYKIIASVVLFYVADRPANALQLSLRLVSAADVARAVYLARGQLLLSLYTAVSVMGPQLVISASFSAAIAVMFNTHRTYMRLAAAVINVLNASAWPVLTSLFANKDLATIRLFAQRHAGLGLLLAAVLATALWLVSGPVFGFLFSDKVQLDPLALALIGVAVVLSCGTTIQQTMSLATNIPSRAAAIGIAIFALGLALVSPVGHVAGIYWALAILVAVEAAVFAGTTIGSFRQLGALAEPVHT
jgi:O-antigen/teichoic acid export membrane protein